MPRSLALVLLLASCGAAPVAPERVESLEDLAWMLGDWEAHEPRWLFHLRWTRVSPTLFDGESRETSLQGERFPETLVMEQRGTEIVYGSWLRRHPRAELLITASSTAGFVAESPGDESLSRVEYRLVSADEIEATFSGPQRTTTRTLRRVPSEGVRAPPSDGMRDGEL